MNRSSAQPNMQIHVNETTSMVKVFQQQALLNNTLMSMPVFLGEKNLFDPWVTAVENAVSTLVHPMSNQPTNSDQPHIQHVSCPASGLSHHKVIAGLNSDKLCGKLASTCTPNWHTMADCFCDVKKFGESFEQTKGYRKDLVS